MILELSDGTSALARGAAALTLALHVTAGAVSIAFGAVALWARKGSYLHRRAGHWFLGCMLVMAGLGAGISPFLPHRNWANVSAGVFTCYLVLTSWMTVRRPGGGAGRFERGAFLVALGACLADATLGLQAAGGSGPGDGTPVPAYFVFATLAGLAAVGDLRLVLHRSLTGPQRLTRHLWRMCVAMFIGAASFFLGQQQVFPAAWRGSPLLFVPELAILGSLFYWLVRIRFAGGFRQATAGVGPARDPKLAAPRAV